MAAQAKLQKQLEAAEKEVEKLRVTAQALDKAVTPSDACQRCVVCVCMRVIRHNQSTDVLRFFRIIRFTTTVPEPFIGGPGAGENKWVAPPPRGGCCAQQ